MRNITRVFWISAAIIILATAILWRPASTTIPTSHEENPAKGKDLRYEHFKNLYTTLI